MDVLQAVQWPALACDVFTSKINATNHAEGIYVEGKPGLLVLTV